MSAKQSQAQNCIDNIFKYSLHLLRHSNAKWSFSISLVPTQSCTQKLSTDSMCCTSWVLKIHKSINYLQILPSPGSDRESDFPWHTWWVSVTAVIITWFYLSQWAVCWENNASWNVLQNTVYIFSPHRESTSVTKDIECSSKCCVFRDCTEMIRVGRRAEHYCNTRSTQFYNSIPIRIVTIHFAIKNLKCTKNLRVCSNLNPNVLIEKYCEKSTSQT